MSGTALYRIAFLIAFLALCSSEKQGVYVGSFEQFLHDVSGKLFIVDQKTLRIQDFTYDGEGPATVFWIGLKGQHSLEIDESGIPLLDERGNSGPLRKYEHENFTLTLPDGVYSQDLLWVAVWCQIFKLDFGHVTLPKDLKLEP